MHFLEERERENNFCLMMMIFVLNNFYSELKKNKGSILKATVGYIKELKIKEQKMHYLEDSKKHLHNKYQKLLFRTFVSENFENLLKNEKLEQF